MERKMRRFRQALDRAVCDRMLHEASNGVLSLVDMDGCPYGVPLSFAYDDGDGCLYFHSAVSAHKIDCIRDNCRCSFTVINQDLIVPDEFTSYFRSVIVKGRITICDSSEETLKGLRLLCDKYSPGIDSSTEIAKCLAHVLVLRLDISEISGKEAIELVRERERRLGNS